MLNLIVELLKNLKFLEALCFVLAALVLQFAPEYAISSAVLLSVVIAVLKMFNIVPEAWARLKLRKAAALKKTAKRIVKKG